MQPRLGCFVRNLDLGTEANQFVECPFFGRPGVDTGDHTHVATPKKELLQFSADQAEAGEPHEGAQQVDSICTQDFQRNLRANLQIPVTIHQKGAVSEWNAGAPGRTPGHPLNQRLFYFEEEPSFRGDLTPSANTWGLNGQRMENSVGDLNLNLTAIHGRFRKPGNRFEDPVVDVPSQHIG